MASRKKADEEKLKRRRLAKFRFKRLVHVVICNRYWIAEIEDREIGNNVHRNVAVIDRRLTHKGTLTIIEKKILNSSLEERTENKRHLLRRVLRKIECLHDLSMEQLDNIAGCATFEYFGPGRVILREGHQPHSVYFLANGEIVVSRLTWDSVYRTYNDTPCGTRARGQMFGEIALLHDCLRTATCSTANFDRILRQTLLERWQQLQFALQRFDYFKYWTNAQVRECCLLSRIVTFETQQKLPVDVDKGYAYFVLSGQCMILQCLTVSKKNGSYRLLPIATNDSFTAKQTSSDVLDSKIPQEQPIEHRFIDVGTFSCGSVFGLGEAMKHRMVVARNRVQCLVIPCDWLFEKQQNVGNTWHRIRMKLDMAIQRDRLFELFMRDQHWQCYRKTLVREFVRRNPRQNQTQLADVPIMCRIEQGKV
ncbi:cGMP-dependent protein kinase 1-like isoform X2 [Anopheles funestus]|uniref:cGMP-dependent protein kinase 1-like isoform X2 n=1 Tax=Anopheles funestus TaxID=62324 RepID=UPI0020C68EFF|nr:cGMP-dependent protein kinase 1-like isoform X2 [Anopheles funestus]